MSLNQVISLLVEEMHHSRDRLDSMAAKLDTITRADPRLNVDVMRFIDGIRIMDTGTLIYSYVRIAPNFGAKGVDCYRIESPRYGVQKYQQPDGSLDIVL